MKVSRKPHFPALALLTPKDNLTAGNATAGNALAPNTPEETPPSFISLLVAELPKLRGTAIFLTRRVADADDLLQETAMRAIAAQHQFAMGTNLRAWLHRIMRNEFISTFRKKRATTATDDLPEGLLSVSASQEDRVFINQVFAAMGRLSPPHLETLVLSFSHGLEYQQIAEIQNCTLGTVKSRLFRAREALKDYLLEEAPRAAPGREPRKLSVPGKP